MFYLFAVVSTACVSGHRTSSTPQTAADRERPALSAVCTRPEHPHT